MNEEVNISAHLTWLISTRTFVSLVNKYTQRWNKLMVSNVN